MKHATLVQLKQTITKQVVFLLSHEYNFGIRDITKFRNGMG